MALDIITGIDLDMKRPNFAVVYANQYDSAGRVRAQLLNGGQKWAVPVGAKGVVMFKKTDDIGGFYDVTEFDVAAVTVDTDRSVVYIALDVQTMTTAGRVAVQVNFYQSGQRLSSFSFSLLVQPSAIQNADLESNWIFNILANEISEIITDAATMAPTITTWLAEHIIQETGYVLDTSLTVANAAADAKAVGDKIAALKADALIQSTSSLSSSDNINTFVNAGQWILTAGQGIPLNWPSSALGRLIVFGNHENNHTIRAQMVIDYDKNVFVRIGKSAGWENWVNLAEPRGSLSGSSDVDDYIKGGQWILPANQGLPSHWPSTQTGRLIVFGDNDATRSIRVQMVVDYLSDVYVRMGRSTGWDDWKLVNDFVSYTTYTVRSDGSGQFTNIAAAIRYVMQQRSSINKNHQAIIDVGAGEFSLSLVADYIGEHSVDPRGLFLVPYVTLRGKGKDKTTLYWYYSGSDDDIMSVVSGLNVPYTSKIEDMTISVKNLRYAVHSDGPVSTEAASFDNPYLNNTDIVCKNVRFEHLGFDSGKNPSYLSPAAWGGGSWDSSNRTFINCDFISAENAGFLSHDRVGITQLSEFEFDSCTFVSRNTSTVLPPTLAGLCSCALISWGAGIKTTVNFKNCKANKYVGLTVKTDNGNPDAVIDYHVYADNDIPIFESTTNDAHKNNNYITGACEVDYCSVSAGVGAYKPVSKNGFSGIREYNSSDDIRGVALHDCALNGKCVYQIKGYLPLPLLTSTAFATGTKLGYSNGEWVEDNVNPILQVVCTNVVKLI